MGWAEQEFETIDLGDPRLNRRAVLLAERPTGFCATSRSAVKR